MHREDLTLTQIEAFRAAAPSLTLAEAGPRIGVYGAAIGRSIKTLERSLGCRLFHGCGRRRRITEAGQAASGLLVFSLTRPKRRRALASGARRRTRPVR
jgi:hypothetical protein